MAVAKSKVDSVFSLLYHLCGLISLSLIDSALFALADHCRSLAVLGISGCDKVGDEAVVSLVDAHGLSLRSLKLCETNISGATFIVRAFYICADFLLSTH